MSGRIRDSMRRSTVHFKNRLVENQYKVLPPPPIPPHIIKPQYAMEPENPNFAIYDGHPRILKG